MTDQPYCFELMDDASARSIAAWHYDPPYTFYNLDEDPDDLHELLSPVLRGNAYFSVKQQGGLVGFFQFLPQGDTVTIGLGLRPDLTGQGMGLSFLEAGLQFARERYAPAHFALDVATFNQRAMKVYERAGFQPVRTELRRANRGVHEFLHMRRPAENG